MQRCERPAAVALAISAVVLLAAGCTAPSGESSRPSGSVGSTLVSSSPTLPVTGSGTWSEGARLPFPVAEMAAAAMDGKLYVVGGMTRADPPVLINSTRHLQIYDVASGRWEQGAELPDARDHMSVAALDGTLYVSGGGRWYPGGSFAQLWAYDPQRDRWTTRHPMPAVRRAHAMVSLSGKLYVLGGVTLPDNRADEVWAYDPTADRWSVAPTRLPTLREHVTAVVAADKVYLIGGRWQGNLGTVEAYDPAANAWEKLPDMPTPRSGLAAAMLGQAVHVGGGEDPVDNRAFRRHEVLDLATGTWSRYPDLPVTRHGIGSGALDGRWFVAGGSRDAGTGQSDTLFIYSP